MYQTKSAENTVPWGSRGGGPKFKAAQNGMKYILVLEFFKSSNIFKVRKKFVSGDKQASMLTQESPV